LNLTLGLPSHGRTVEDDRDRMASRTAVPETALAARRYCATRCRHRTVTRSGSSATSEGPASRSTSVGHPGPDLEPEWSHLAVVQLRHNPDEHDWRLYSADRDRRWHLYDLREPTTTAPALLAELDADPTGIFWG
jgi:hypothetical protein